MGGRVFLGLAHYPVYNKNREIITTSVTNLDIHDIARCGATYDVAGYYIIHPHPAQRAIVTELLAFWREGFGGEYNPDRKEALARLRLAASLDDAEREILAGGEGRLLRVVTDARAFPQSVSYQRLRSLLTPAEASRGRAAAPADGAADSTGSPVGAEPDYFLLFGTGYGLTEDVIAAADLVLAPVLGRGDYNHLPVRGAAAIILDRLLGPAWWRETF